VLLHLEHADGLEKSKLFQREAGSETVLRVYPCSHDEGAEVENDDRRHIGRARNGAEARHEIPGLRAHRHPNRHRLMSDRPKQGYG
jgi:hypothetical protein